MICFTTTPDALAGHHGVVDLDRYSWALAPDAAITVTLTWDGVVQIAHAGVEHVPQPEDRWAPSCGDDWWAAAAALAEGPVQQLARDVRAAGGLDALLGRPACETVDHSRRDDTVTVWSALPDRAAHHRQAGVCYQRAGGDGAVERVVLDHDGYPATRDGSGRVADWLYLGREIDDLVWAGGEE